MSCEGCGRCCEHVGTPPGHAYGFGCEAPAWFVNSDDGERLRRMPHEDWAELATYYVTVDADLTADRSAYDMPCLWYDGEAKRCRHHEWRPDVCRQFEVGSRSCNSFRLEVGLDRVARRRAG